jgi:hypothetical protein
MDNSMWSNLRLSVPAIIATPKPLPTHIHFNGKEKERRGVEEQLHFIPLRGAVQLPVPVFPIPSIQKVVSLSHVCLVTLSGYTCQWGHTLPNKIVQIDESNPLV